MYTRKPILQPNDIYLSPCRKFAITEGSLVRPQAGRTLADTGPDSALPDGDAIVVRAPSPEPQVDRGGQTAPPSPPQSRSPSPPTPLERLQDAGEADTERQRRRGRIIRPIQRYGAQRVTYESPQETET